MIKNGTIKKANMLLINCDMIQLDFATIFPQIIEPYMQTAMMRKAVEKNIMHYAIHDIRACSTDKHKRVDDAPYGGGAGMVMQVEPIYHVIEHIKKQHETLQKRRIVLLSAKGKEYSQRDAERLQQYEQIIFICGRYEGVDERVAQYIADEELSIGQYVLTGGELAAMVIADSIVRLLPHVLGNKQSIVRESYCVDLYKEYPQYTRPEEFHTWKVPEVLLSGNHELIEKWRKNHSK